VALPLFDWKEWHHKTKKHSCFLWALPLFRVVGEVAKKALQAGGDWLFNITLL
jgi:hypothetical protein